MDKFLNILLSKKVIAPIIIIAVSILVYLVLKNVIKKILVFKTANTKKDVKKINTVTMLCINILKFFIIIIATLMILEVYGIDTKSIIASLGVFSAVLALALQDTIKDFAMGISIIVEGQFSIGDVVTIGGFKGEVTSITLKSVRIKSYTGEIKIVANRNISEVINHSMASSLAIVDVGVSYDSDLDKVEKVLNALCEKLSKEVEEINGDVKVLGINELGSSSITYRVTASTRSMKHLDVQRLMMREIKDAFDKNNIEIPYNQLVIHNG